MKKIFAVTIAFALLFLTLSFNIAMAQQATTHGFQDQKYTAEQLKELGASMYGRGKLLKEQGEKMMREGTEMQKSVPLAADKGIPGGPQYMIEKGKMIKEMGEKMMVEGERMIREADAISFGVPATPKK
jgi:polyhydroxyalkanoate synthesis regulator phasin